MKLEIKHIAPYLPYELQFKDPETVVPGVMVAIVAGMPGLLFYESKDEIEYFDLSAIKPLLIPLSELSDQHLMCMGAATHRLGRKYMIQLVCNQSINLRDYNYLISHHFDVFGLIPAGIALNKLDHI